MPPHGHQTLHPREVTDTNPPPPNPPQNNDSQTSALFIVLGVFLGIGMLAVLLWCMCCRDRRNKHNNNNKKTKVRVVRFPGTRPPEGGFEGVSRRRVTDGDHGTSRGYESSEGSGGDFESSVVTGSSESESRVGVGGTGTGYVPGAGMRFVPGEGAMGFVPAVNGGGGGMGYVPGGGGTGFLSGGNGAGFVPGENGTAPFVPSRGGVGGFAGGDAGVQEPPRTYNNVYNAMQYQERDSVTGPPNGGVSGWAGGDRGGWPGQGDARVERPLGRTTTANLPLFSGAGTAANGRPQVWYQSRWETTSSSSESAGLR